MCAAAMAVLVWLVWCLVQRAADRRPPELRLTAWSVLCIVMQQGQGASPPPEGSVTCRWEKLIGKGPIRPAAAAKHPVTV